MLFGLAAVGSLCFALTLFVPGSAPAPAPFPEPAPAGASIGPRVRGATPAVNTMIANGIRRSATFARLVRDIDQTDVIVYIEITNQMPTGLDGRLTFLTSAGGFRYLRVQIVPTIAKDDVIAVVGHELQHALEVAAHPRVQSSRDLATLYRQIGMQAPGIDRYDTNAARIVGRRVRAELLD